MAETTSPARASWSGKLAFVLAAAASAVGLGSMWRFPYLAAKYGGGTFLFVYLVFVFTIGIALLLLETALGRHTRQSAIGAFKAFGKKYAFIGIFTSAVPFIIVPYYCVIGGWVTKYLVGYVTDGPAALADGGAFFSNFIADGPQSIVFMLIFMALTYFTVAVGVNKGIEKANLVMMPLLIIMAAAVAIYALTMPGALDGLAFYLLPDLSAISPELIISALGQTFFTLSLAMGIMVTYGSYLDKSTKLTSSVVQDRRHHIRRVAARRHDDHSCDIRCVGLRAGRRRELRPLAHVHHPAAGVPEHGSRGIGAGLCVLHPGAVRCAHQLHLAGGNLHVHHSGRYGLLPSPRTAVHGDFRDRHGHYRESGLQFAFVHPAAG